MKKSVLTTWMLLSLLVGSLFPSLILLAEETTTSTSIPTEVVESSSSSDALDVPESSSSLEEPPPSSASEPSSSVPETSTETESSIDEAATEPSSTPVPSSEDEATPATSEEEVTTSKTETETDESNPEAAQALKPIYRLYHPGTGEHLYTPSVKEKDVLYQKAGWGYEGIAWYAPSKGQAVYRLYNSRLKNHLYTTDINEVKVLTSQHGWTKDFNGAPIFYSGGSVSIFRLYNKALRGLHHWTTDSNEYNVLPRHGWRQEGIALKAEKKGQQIYTQYAADEALAAQVKGLGGYRLSGKAKRDVVKAIKRVHAQGYKMGFVMMDVRTQKGVEFNADQRFYAASTVKGPYVASLAAKNPRSIQESRAIMQQVLSYSSNDGYAYLVNRYKFSSWYQWLAEAGVRSDIGKDLYPFYSSRELFKLWQRNYTYFTDDKTGQQVGLWFENPNLSPIKSVLGKNYRTRSKAGWIGGWGLFSASDGGIVYAKNGPYIIAIMTDASGQLDQLNPTVAALNSLVLTLNEAHQEMAPAQ